MTKHELCRSFIRGTQLGRYAIRTLFLLLFLTMTPLFFLQAAQAAPGDFLFEWGADFHFYTPQISPFPNSGIGPNAIEMDANGNVYLVDSGFHRIEVYSSTGTLLKKIGSPGAGELELVTPRSIALDTSGNVYVGDYGADGVNGKVMVLATDGAFVRTIRMTGEDQLFRVRDVAVDGSGKIYILSESSNKIYRFSREGELLGTLVSYGIGSVPKGMGLDQSGNLYVAVAGNNSRIDVYSSTGALLRAMGSHGSGDGQLSFPSEVAFDQSGNVYVADTLNNRISVFTAAGAFLRNIGSFGSGDGQLTFPKGTAIAKNGNLYVVDGTNGRVVIFSNQGTFLTAWSSYGSGDGEFYRPWGVDLDENGNIYVADLENRRIEVFTADGTFVRKVVRPATGDGLLSYPKQVVADNSGNVYVTDSLKSRIEVFDEEGAFVRTIGSYGTGDGQFRYPYAIAFDASGNLNIPDGYINHRIQVFTREGLFVKTVALTGSGDEWSAFAITFDRGGNIYLADTTNHRIAVFSSDGTFVRDIGRYGSGDGELDNPHDVAVDGSGNVYVADAYNNRIQVFSSAGVYLGQWGSFGQAAGEFGRPGSSESEGNYGGPGGLAVDPMGTVVYVADTYNNRMQAFVGYGATHFAVSAPSNAKAGSPIQFTVTALDAAGNKAAGYSGTVHFTSSDGSAILPADSKLTDGVGIFQATLNTTGDRKITATDTTTASITGTSNAIVVTSTMKLPDLTITKSHKCIFTQGKRSNYTIKVTNKGTAATSGQVRVVDKLPSSLKAVAMKGCGWVCNLGTLTCTRSSSLAAGSSYSQIVVTVDVARDAPSSVTNKATVSGGGEVNTANNKASDVTKIGRKVHRK